MDKKTKTTKSAPKTAPKKTPSTTTKPKSTPKKSMDAMESMKFEIASELGVDLKKGYNGNLTSKEAGYIGGNMVKKMVDQYKKDNSNKK